MLEAWILSQMRSGLLWERPYWKGLTTLEGKRRPGTKIQKKKKSETTSPYLQSVMLGQVSGPRIRAITKSLPRGTPSSHQNAGKSLFTNTWALTWCAVTPSSELTHQGRFFHSRLGRRNLLSAVLKSTWLCVHSRSMTPHFMFKVQQIVFRKSGTDISDLQFTVCSWLCKASLRKNY